MVIHTHLKHGFPIHKSIKSWHYIQLCMFFTRTYVSYHEQLLFFSFTFVCKNSSIIIFWLVNGRTPLLHDYSLRLILHIMDGHMCPLHSHLLSIKYLSSMYGPVHDHMAYLVRKFLCLSLSCMSLGQPCICV